MQKSPVKFVYRHCTGVTARRLASIFPKHRFITEDEKMPVAKPTRPDKLSCGNNYLMVADDVASRRRSHSFSEVDKISLMINHQITTTRMGSAEDNLNR